MSHDMGAAVTICYKFICSQDAKTLAKFWEKRIILYMDNGIEKGAEMQKINFGVWLDGAAIAHVDDGFGNLLPVAYDQLIFSAGDANLVFDLF